MRKSGLRVSEALVVVVKLGRQTTVCPKGKIANSLLAIWEVRSGLGKSAHILEIRGRKVSSAPAIISSSSRSFAITVWPGFG
jgi:hypothetical protein